MDVSFATAAGMGASRRGTRAIAQAGSIRVSGKWPSCSSAVWPPAGASITWLCTIVVPAGAVCACGAGSSGNATMAATAAADTFLRIGRFLSKTFSIRAASGRVSSDASGRGESTARGRRLFGNSRLLRVLDPRARHRLRLDNARAEVRVVRRKRLLGRAWPLFHRRAKTDDDEGAGDRKPRAEQVG